VKGKRKRASVPPAESEGEVKMKIWQIKSPGSVPTLLKLDTEEGKPLQCIVIGEKGRGRREVIIPITGNGSYVRPKKIGDSIVLVRGK